MKKQQVTVAATILITSLSFVFCNADPALATGNRLQKNFFSSNSRDYFTQQIEVTGQITIDEESATSQIGPKDHTQPTISRDLWTITKELFYTLSDAIRPESGNNKEIQIDADNSEQDRVEELMGFTDDRNEDNRPAPRALNSEKKDLDSQWVVSFSPSCRIICSVDYNRQKYQQIGRIYLSSESMDTFSTSLDQNTHFDTTYHQLLPRIGLEKQMDSKTKLTAVMKIPAYNWTEYEANDPDIERFNPATGDTDTPAEKGVHGEISFNQKMSGSMFLQLALSYQIIEASDPGRHPAHDITTSDSSIDSGEHMGATFILGSAL